VYVYVGTIAWYYEVIQLVSFVSILFCFYPFIEFIEPSDDIKYGKFRKI
jgi:hypothetical protein